MPSMDFAVDRNDVAGLADHAVAPLQVLGGHALVIDLGVVRHQDALGAGSVGSAEALSACSLPRAFGDPTSAKWRQHGEPQPDHDLQISNATLVPRWRCTRNNIAVVKRRDTTSSTKHHGSSSASVDRALRKA